MSSVPYTPTFSSYIPSCPKKMELKAPPIPMETTSKESGNGRRSFSLGMGRKKSVKAR